jgi:hypothetical protein
MKRTLHLATCITALGLCATFVADAQGPVVGVFFNEGWESGSMTQSFNSAYYGSAAPPQFSVSTAFFAPGGTSSLRHRLSAGMTGDDVAYATQHFGDATSTPRWSNGAGQHFYDLYVQYKVYYSNWDTTQAGLTKGIELGTEDGMAHNEVCCNPGFANYMAVYPMFGQDWSLEVVNKQGPGPEWIGYRQNSSGYSSSNVFRMQNGRWYTVEVRRKLNDAGVDNGIISMWVDGVLIIHYTNVRLRVPRNGSFGTDFTYGTNWVMISEYGPSSRDESVYYDDFKLSTSYIGVGSTTAPPPAAPTNVRIIR